MNEAFEKYWADQLKSCGATCERERILPPYQEVFEAGAAAIRDKAVELCYQELAEAHQLGIAIAAMEYKGPAK